MRHFEPCLCGSDDCPACYPGRATRRFPLGSLSAEDCDILNAEYDAEQAAADEEAELYSRPMLEDDDDAPPLEHDLL